MKVQGIDGAAVASASEGCFPELVIFAVLRPGAAGGQRVELVIWHRCFLLMAVGDLAYYHFNSLIDVQVMYNKGIETETNQGNDSEHRKFD